MEQIIDRLLDKIEELERKLDESYHNIRRYEKRLMDLEDDILGVERALKEKGLQATKSIEYEIGEIGE